MKKYRNIILFAGVIFFSILLLIKSKSVFEGIKTGLNLCADTVIPSLFPFMVISSFAGNMKTGDNFILRLIAKIFNVPVNCVKIIMMSFVCGYPVGLKMIVSTFEKSEITEKQAKRMSIFCVNAGPAFIVNAVGNKIFGSSVSGLVLFAGCLSASVITGIISGICAGEKVTDNKITEDNEISPGDNLILSVNSGINGIISICGWIILFSCMQSIIFCFIENQTVKNIISVVAEVTTGCETSGKINGLPLCSFCISFGGICVALQNYPFIKKTGLKLKNYFLYRIINGGLSYLIVSVIVKFIPECNVCISQYTAEFSPHTVSSCVLLFAFAVMMMNNEININKADT